MKTMTDARIADLLGKANRKRRERTLKPGEVMAIISVVRDDGADRASCHAGEVANAYKYPTQTTVALAVMVDGKCYLGIGTCDATSPTPGRVWKVLQPWGKGGPDVLEAKFRLWTKEPDVICLDDEA